MNNIFVWKKGEKLAQNYLKKLGYKILGANVKNKIAEVDIICEKNDEIVFVEVKSRENTFFGNPAEAVTIKKQQSYINFAKSYMVNNRLVGKNIRFDVIEILGDDINHIESAFDTSCMKYYLK